MAAWCFSGWTTSASRWSRSTPTERTVVPLGETGERVPGIHTERFDHVVIHRPFAWGASADTALTPEGIEQPDERDESRKSLQITYGRTWDRTRDLSRVKRALSR